MRTLLRIALAAFLAWCIFMNYGCSQRIVQYDPVTGAWRYKSNSFATDSQADRVTIRTPSGIVVEIDKAYVNNDSLTFRLNPITKQVEVVTESGE